MYSVVQSDWDQLMSDLHKALADIGSIRSQMAAGTLFRGFGPQVVALTGLLAITLAAAQTAWPVLAPDRVTAIAAWVGLALLSGGLVGTEMLARTKRHHGGLADAMLFQAAAHFLTVGLTGALIGLIILNAAPDIVWMQVGGGLLAAIRFLPRPVAWIAAWYIAAGAIVLMWSCQTLSLSPWAMGVPFGAGQLMLAAVLYLAQGGDDGEAN
jgi:hypothetical protein